MFEEEPWDCGGLADDLSHGLFGKVVNKDKSRKTKKAKSKKRPNEKDLSKVGTTCEGNNGTRNKDGLHYIENRPHVARGNTKISLKEKVSREECKLLDSGTESGTGAIEHPPVNHMEQNEEDKQVEVKSKGKCCREKRKDRQKPDEAEEFVQSDVTSSHDGDMKKRKRKRNRKELNCTDLIVQETARKGKILLQENNKQINYKDITNSDICMSETDDLPRTLGQERNRKTNDYTAQSKKTSLHQKLQQRLQGGRFRWINEQLYTTTGDMALELFTNDPHLFDVYHEGFAQQVQSWPTNPVDIMIQWLKERSTSLVVADFGCGEAVIAQSVPNKVHSFDLVAKNGFVTVCDMASVPLQSCSVDVAIFCLALMGTNTVDFLKEAHRVLKLGGILKIAEVVSRFDDIESFLKNVCKLGFKLTGKDQSNKMFVMLEMIKQRRHCKELAADALQLKPCQYKKR